jgi:membrane associated rhomboid family serine protease
MIIVPTEKSLDWRHAPLVLCTLVFINVMVFFLYQSGDTPKIIEAISRYHAQGFIQDEWPIFEAYLEEQGDAQLTEYRREYAKGEYDYIIADLLMREDFYRYLQIHVRSYLTPDRFDQWVEERVQLHGLIQSLSYVANGLQANKLSIPSFLTHQFLHGDIMHLLGNMFFLIVCGFAVEAAIGHWRFLLFYLLSGVGAGFAQVATDWTSSQPLIGASGAISGVMAMYLAVFRFKKIEFFYWFFFVVGYFRAPALLILPFYIGKEIYQYQTDTHSNIAFMAHAGGFVTGALLIGVAWLMNRSLFNDDYINNDQSIDSAQKTMAEIYEAIEKFRFERALQLVDALIAEKGNQFEWAMIRYNLLKIQRGAALQPAVITLLTLPLLTSDQIKKLERVWLDNPEVHESLSEGAALKLAMQFSALENPRAAEQLFNGLAQKGCTNPAMSVLATKLAAAFLRLRDTGKRAHYEQLATQFAQGAERALL